MAKNKETKDQIPTDDEQMETTENVENVVLKPVIKVTATDKHIIINNFEPRPGEYHIVALDKSGNEVPDSDFSASKRSYEKYYSNPEKFLVKKNHQ